MRRGSSLIEALIALVLFQFGMLAMVATSAVAARDLAEANRRVRAHALAANRVEHLRALACSSSAAGSMSWPGGLTEYWRVDASGTRRIISDSGGAAPAARAPGESRDSGTCAVLAVRRRGFTLHEMLISLALTGAVLALAAHSALSQLRFFVGVAEIVGVRAQTGHASAVVARALWGTSPGAGDIIVAMDSALETHATIGSAVVCQASIGRATIAAPEAGDGNALAGFLESPEAGDRIHVFFDDSLGSGWLTLHLATAPAVGGACLTFPQVAATWTLDLREPVTLPAGAALRFTRPLRLSLYRGSDNKWYLGARDWNGASGRFNTTQPVAGPLGPYSTNPDKTGFLLIYRDATGAQLDAPVDVLRIASVAITSRALSFRPIKVWGIAPSTAEAFGDSVSVAVSPRNAR